jgi:hypothetical protein
MAIEQIPGVGPQNTDIASAVVTAGTSAGFAATGPTTTQIAAALPTNSSIASAVAAAVPTNSSIANAVAAAVPTNANIQNIVTTYGNLSGGLDFRTMTAQQTFNTSSNNVTVSGRNWVYALIAGGGCGGGSVNGNTNVTAAGPGGGVAFGMVPVSPVAIVAAGGNGGSSVKGNDGGFTIYSGLRANGGSRYTTYANTSGTFGGWHNQYNINIGTLSASGFPGFAGAIGWPGQYTDSNSAIGNAGVEWQVPFFQGAYMSFMNQQFQAGWGGTTNDYNGGTGATGGGGHAQRSNFGAPTTGGSGGRSMLFAGGNGGVSNTTATTGGGGGGGGISGAGGNGVSNNSANTPGAGGAGGNGGGGGGSGGMSNNSSQFATGGVGGTGAVILYY